MLHHSVSWYLAVLMIMTGFFKPTIHKFYAFPVGLAFYMSYGVFLMDCIGLESAMYIHEPLIAGTIFTWYFVGFLIGVATAAVLIVYDYVGKRLSKKATKGTSSNTTVV
jgi:predicted benzoate:H+ symporter BenE